MLPKIRAFFENSPALPAKLFHISTAAFAIATLASAVAAAQSVTSQNAAPGKDAPVNSAPPPPSLDKAFALQDVVITARHRTEKAQSVPISLTAIDKSQIQNLGSNNLSKIKQLVPSLTVDAFNPRQTGLDIRGIGSNGFMGYDGLEGGVAEYEDGVLLGRSSEAAFDIPNISQIEVLRGPQGTLFGKNAVAGAIVINTKRPSFTPEADFSASLGNYNSWQLQGYATGPLGSNDNAAASIAVHATQHGGFFKNTANGLTEDNQDDKGVQTQFFLAPESNLTIRIIANYDHQEANCCFNTPTGLVTNYANGQPVPVNAITRYAIAGYTLPRIDPFARTTDLNNWEHYAYATGSLSAQADYDLGGYTLTSITAGGFYDWYPKLDADGTGLNFFPSGNNTVQQRQFTQELRATSPLGGPVDFTSGLFFFYQQLNDQAILIYGSQAASVITGLAPHSGATWNTYNTALNGFGSAATDIPETYSGAAYGQATWHITPKLDLTGGARLTYEDKTGVYYASEEGGVSVAPGSAAQIIRSAFAPTLAYHLQHSDLLPGGLVTLSYKPAANILTYATYSHGEKSAGLNFISSTITPKIVAPEKLDNYEIGIKNTLLNGRLLLNGDAFWEEDTDYQSTIIRYFGSGVLSYLSSVPKVRSRGLEMDAHAQVTDGLNLFVSSAFDDAYYESDPSGPCPFELSNLGKSSCDLTGRPVAANSKWVASIGGEYDYPLAPYRGHDTVAYFGGNILLKTGFYSTSDDSEYGYVPGYALGNVRFGIRQTNGSWDLSGWVQNITDHRYYVYRTINTSLALPLYNLVTGQVGDPLTFGVTLRAKFE